MTKTKQVPVAAVLAAILISIPIFIFLNDSLISLPNHVKLLGLTPLFIILLMLCSANLPVFKHDFYNARQYQLARLLLVGV